MVHRHIRAEFCAYALYRVRSCWSPSDVFAQEGLNVDVVAGFLALRRRLRAPDKSNSARNAVAEPSKYALARNYPVFISFHSDTERRWPIEVERCSLRSPQMHVAEKNSPGDLIDSRCLQTSSFIDVIIELIKRALHFVEAYCDRGIRSSGRPRCPNPKNPISLHPQTKSLGEISYNGRFCEPLTDGLGLLRVSHQKESTRLVPPATCLCS